MKTNRSGFSLPELLIVLTVLGVLFGLSSTNLLGILSKNSLTSSFDVLIGDIKNQQLKAMVGDTEGSSSHDAYGLYIQSDRYTLFKGPTYNPSEITNFEIKLSEDLEFSSIIVPDQQIIFAAGSGEFVDFDPNYDYITLRNPQTDETKTLQLNRYGTIKNIY